MTTRAIVAASKLAIPTSRRSLVPRADLLARMGSDFRMALVSAPAGYGKTATLASWAATVEEPVAWLSCDPFDVEPSRFMTGLLTALSMSWPGVADDAFVLLDREGASTLEPAVAAANELREVGRGVVIVDDLHLAAPDPAVLTAFIHALPEGFRLVVGTRSDPPLPLARLHVRGDLLELRTDDLRFRDAEMAAFFDLHGVALPGHDLVRLQELTEGWPAGVQLAAIALQRGVGADHFIDAFTRTDRSVSDFLLSEVLAQLPADLVDFLVTTSVLDAFDAELCTAVTGRGDAATVIERLLAANLFVVPLDDRARWYRYHHLFGTFLRARLASLGTSNVRAAHDRAGSALEARGDVTGALQHAMALDDADRAGRILHEAVIRTMSLPEGVVVARQAIRLWLHQCGAEAVHTNPMTVLEFAIGLITLGGGQQGSSWLERVSRVHPEADGEVRALVEAAWGEYHQHRGEPLEAIRREESAMDAVHGDPPGEGLLALLPTVLARAHLQAGDVPRAAAVIESARTSPLGNPVADEVRHPAVAAFVAALMGELTSAEALAEEAARSADALGLGSQEIGRIFAGLARIEVLLERHEDDGVPRLLEVVVRAGDASHRSALQAMVALHHARAARALGDEAAAAAALDHARLLHEAPDRALRRVYDLEAATQALCFDPGRAGPLIDAVDDGGREAQVLRARLALIEREDQHAAALLADVPPPATRRERVERAVLSAASMLNRDVERANLHLREALVAGEPERLVRTLVDLVPDVHGLLKAYTPEPGQDRYVHELLSIADRTVAPVRARGATTLTVPLSERELTVLRYLSSRLTYQEIAAALYVSLNTLKSHVRSVYRKLGVGSRAEAIDAGRQHALI